MIEVVQEICYLGDVVGSSGDVRSIVKARIWAGWQKFCEMCWQKFCEMFQVLETRLRWLGPLKEWMKPTCLKELGKEFQDI